MNLSYYFYKLKKEIEFAVGPDRLHKSLIDLHKFLLDERSKGRLTWHGIPIRFAIKYTSPLTQKKEIERIEQLSLSLIKQINQEI